MHAFELVVLTCASKIPEQNNVLIEEEQWHSYNPDGAQRNCCDGMGGTVHCDHLGRGDEDCEHHDAKEEYDIADTDPESSVSVEKAYVRCDQFANVTDFTKNKDGSLLMYIRNNWSANAR